MRTAARLSRFAQWLFVVPAFVAFLALISAVLSDVVPLLYGVAGCALCLGLAWTVLCGGYGKYPALVIGLALWAVTVAGLAGVSPQWLGLLLAAGALMGLSILCVLAALPWAQARQTRLVQRGQGVIEWEWVFVPRVFVKSHRFYRLSPGIYLVALALVGCVAWAWPIMDDLHFGEPWAYVIYIAATLLAVFAKAAVAYPMVFVGLLGGLPWSLPLIVYWADGARPNFIYRHRFERLTPMEKNNV